MCGSSCGSAVWCGATAKQARHQARVRVAQTAKQSKHPEKSAETGVRRSPFPVPFTAYMYESYSIGVGRRRVLSRYAAIFATLPSCSPVFLLSVALC